MMFRFSTKTLMFLAFAIATVAAMELSRGDEIPHCPRETLANLNAGEKIEVNYNGRWVPAIYQGETKPVRNEYERILKTNTFKVEYDPPVSDNGPNTEQKWTNVRRPSILFKPGQMVEVNGECQSFLDENDRKWYRHKTSRLVKTVNKPKRRTVFTNLTRSRVECPECKQEVDILWFKYDSLSAFSWICSRCKLCCGHPKRRRMAQREFSN